MLRWCDLFTAGQQVSLVGFINLGSAAKAAVGVHELLALNLGRFADYATSLCSWKNTTEKLNHTFGRQALPIMWDFAEVSFLGDMAGNLDWIIPVVAHESPPLERPGHTHCPAPTSLPFPP